MLLERGFRVELVVDVSWCSLLAKRPVLLYPSVLQLDIADQRFQGGLPEAVCRAVRNRATRCSDENLTTVTASHGRVGGIAQCRKSVPSYVRALRRFGFRQGLLRMQR